MLGQQTYFEIYVALFNFFLNKSKTISFNNMPDLLLSLVQSKIFILCKNFTTFSLCYKPRNCCSSYHLTFLLVAYSCSQLFQTPSLS
jgi:hypothetical protein